jgi:hypothetical protein
MTYQHPHTLQAPSHASCHCHLRAAVNGWHSSHLPPWVDAVNVQACCEARTPVDTCNPSVQLNVSGAVLELVRCSTAYWRGHNSCIKEKWSVHHWWRACKLGPHVADCMNSSIFLMARWHVSYPSMHVPACTGLHDGNGRSKRRHDPQITCAVLRQRQLARTRPAACMLRHEALCNIICHAQCPPMRQAVKFAWLTKYRATYPSHRQLPDRCTCRTVLHLIRACAAAACCCSATSSAT